MLKIKYISNFKNNEPYLLLTSTVDGFLNASRFFRYKNPVIINDPSITAISDLGGIENPISLTPDENMRLADIFERIASSEKSAHDYFDIKALPNVEVIISYKEYDDLF